MKTEKLISVTQWFDPHEKPVHVGIYETFITNPKEATDRMFWDGHCWKWVCDNEYCFWQERVWRGVAK